MFANLPICQGLFPPWLDSSDRPDCPRCPHPILVQQDVGQHYHLRMIAVRATFGALSRSRSWRYFWR